MSTRRSFGVPGCCSCPNSPRRETSKSKKEPCSDVAHHKNKQEPAVLKVNERGKDVREEAAPFRNVTQTDMALFIFGHIAKLFSGFWGKGWSLVASTVRDCTPGLGEPLHLSGRTGHIAGAVQRTVIKVMKRAGAARVRHIEAMATVL